MSFVGSRRLNQALPWIAGAVLLFGIALFWQARTNVTSADSPLGERPATDVAAERTVPLEPEARRVAVEFIRTAVVRKNLGRAWEISGPGIRQNLSKREWLTGNIPVVPYPDAVVDRSPIRVDWSYPGDAALSVAMTPKDGSREKPQVFFVGVKKLGGKWLVDYWAPYEPTSVPAGQT